MLDIECDDENVQIDSQLTQFYYSMIYCKLDISYKIYVIIFMMISNEIRIIVYYLTLIFSCEVSKFENEC